MDNNDNISFQSILKTAKLSEKQYKFFENLVNPESETVGDIVKSYHKAGYTDNPTSKYAAYRIYNSTKFQKVLTAYRNKELEKGENRDMSMRERTYQDLDFVIEQAKLKYDLGTMRQAVMDRAKIAGIAVERHQIIDPAAEIEVDQSMKQEAARLAQQRLLGHDFPVIDVECITKLSNSDEKTPIKDE